MSTPHATLQKAIELGGLSEDQASELRIELATSLLLWAIETAEHLSEMGGTDAKGGSQRLNDAEASPGDRVAPYRKPEGLTAGAAWLRRRG